MSVGGWSLGFYPEALDDIKALDKASERLVAKALAKVRVNPLPASEGGYGKPLGNRNGSKLAGLNKIKLRGSGLRVVYELRRHDEEMLVVIVGIRDDEKVYREAARRYKKRHR